MLLVCCGMPRSGSTLQYNIAWKVAQAAKLGHPVAWRSSGDWSRATRTLEDLAASPELYVIKMHFPPDNVKALAVSGQPVRFVYVQRDLFDVIYSMKLKFNFKLPHAIDRVRDALDTENWLLQRPAVDVLIQDYSLLLENLPEAVRQIAAFEKTEPGANVIDRISGELSIASAYEKSRRKTPRFEHLRRKISRLTGRKIAFADDELMLHPNHVSEHRGRIGIGRNKLPPAEIEAIRETFGDRVRGLTNGR